MPAITRASCARCALCSLLVGTGALPGVALRVLCEINACESGATPGHAPADTPHLATMRLAGGSHEAARAQVMRRVDVDRTL